MGSFDREVANPTKGVERKVGENIKSKHLRKTSMKTLTFLKWGKMTCPSRWTLKCGGSPS
jgi:hypothetical protein